MARLIPQAEPNVPQREMKSFFTCCSSFAPFDLLSFQNLLKTQSSLRGPGRFVRSYSLSDTGGASATRTAAPPKLALAQSDTERFP